MATTDDSPVFVDTNPLVYANLALSPFHHRATQRLTILDTAGIQLWVSRQVLREYLAAMTRPGDLTGTIPIESLAEDVRYFAERFYVAEDSLEVTDRLLLLIREIPVGGKQVHDANIVATMQAYGIRRLLTHNTTDFARFSRYVDLLPL